ncbi:hypothetical protein [Dactylosporangium sp. NPDC051484]|uniref:hypothetical protein n=1 Tax=Dactylosporangium sp. NPDC051484 TaxID=3154942 RepID=UPI00344F544D
MATEFVHDAYILVLDGRVLEIFHRGNAESNRVHVAFLGVSVKPKGDRYKVQIGAGYDDQVLSGAWLTMDAAEFERFRSFIALAMAARDSAPNPVQ